MSSQKQAPENEDSNPQIFQQINQNPQISSLQSNNLQKQNLQNSNQFIIQQQQDTNYLIINNTIKENGGEMKVQEKNNSNLNGDQLISQPNSMGMGNNQNFQNQQLNQYQYHQMMQQYYYGFPYIQQMPGMNPLGMQGYQVINRMPPAPGIPVITPPGIAQQQFPPQMPNPPIFPNYYQMMPQPQGNQIPNFQQLYAQQQVYLQNDMMMGWYQGMGPGINQKIGQYQGRDPGQQDYLGPNNASQQISIHGDQIQAQIKSQNFESQNLYKIPINSGNHQKDRASENYEDQQNEQVKNNSAQQKKDEKKSLQRKDANLVKQISCKIKGKAQFESKDGIITVDDRYNVIKCVGSGAYGHVFSAKDKKTGRSVAIKKIHKAFEDVIDAKRVLREIKILKFFEHENIIELIDIQRPPQPTNYEDVYIITQLMEADLHQLIYSRQKLEADHYQYFMYQILRGIYYMHSANIMHRDLKPSNILINAECDLKICDFGLSRGFGEVEEVLKKTAYVVTRWYRAPEVSLLNKSYNQSLDMWSVGCIFAELMQRSVLFPGDTNANEVIMILQLMGVPEDEDLKFIDNEQAMLFIQRQRKAQQEKGKKPINWKKKIPHASDLAIDLLKGLLTFSPDKRLDVEQAINHPYFENLRKLDNPPKCEKKFDWLWEQKQSQNLQNDQDLICKLIYEESLTFHPIELDQSTQNDIKEQINESNDQVSQKNQQKNIEQINNKESDEKDIIQKEESDQKQKQNKKETEQNYNYKQQTQKQIQIQEQKKNPENETNEKIQLGKRTYQERDEDETTQIKEGDNFLD